MPKKFTYEGNDFYCDVAIPRKVPLDVVYEDKYIMAFHHTNPHWPVHIVVIPRQHIPSLTDIDAEDYPVLHSILDLVRILALNVEREHGAARVITNLGQYQDSKHLHFHVCFGEPLK